MESVFRSVLTSGTLCVIHDRAARKKIDGKNFYGKLLKVRYGPEYESEEDVANKLADRRKSMAHLLQSKNERAHHKQQFARTVEFSQRSSL